MKKLGTFEGRQRHCPETRNGARTSTAERKAQVTAEALLSWQARQLSRQPPATSVEKRVLVVVI